jgi:hypothetical protein
MVLNQINQYIKTMSEQKDKINIIIAFINRISFSKYTNLSQITFNKDKLILNNTILDEFKEQIYANFNIKLKILTDKNIIRLINRLLNSINFELCMNKTTKIYKVQYILE